MVLAQSGLPLPSNLKHSPCPSGDCTALPRGLAKVTWSCVSIASIPVFSGTTQQTQNETPFGLFCWKQLDQRGRSPAIVDEIVIWTSHLLDVPDTTPKRAPIYFWVTAQRPSRRSRSWRCSLLAQQCQSSATVTGPPCPADRHSKVRVATHYDRCRSVFFSAIALAATAIFRL